MKYSLLLLGLFLLAPAMAQEPTPAPTLAPARAYTAPSIAVPVSAASLVGPKEAPVRTPVWLTLDGVPANAVGDTKWGLFPQHDGDQFMRLFDAEGRPVCFFWSSTPGKRAIFVDVNVPGNYQLLIHEIAYGEGEVKPVPFPPDPKPNPTPGKRHVIILEETGPKPADQKRREEYTKILFSPKLRSYLKEKGHQLTIPDVSDVPRELAQRKLADQSLPRLIIEDGDGKLLYQGPLPKTVDAVIKTIKANGG